MKQSCSLWCYWVWFLIYRLIKVFELAYLSFLSEESYNSLPVTLVQVGTGEEKET